MWPSPMLSCLVRNTFLPSVQWCRIQANHGSPFQLRRERSELGLSTEIHKTGPQRKRPQGRGQLKFAKEFFMNLCPKSMLYMVRVRLYKVNKNSADKWFTRRRMNLLVTLLLTPWLFSQDNETVLIRSKVHSLSRSTQQKQNKA